MIEATELSDLLADYTVPFLGKKLGSTEASFQAEEHDNNVKIIITLSFPMDIKFLEDDIRKYLSGLEFELLKPLNFEIKFKISSYGNTNSQPISGIKNIIAIASGKGGVGKSTIANGIARTLVNFGVKVALLDADIYGPSQPLMQSISGEKATSDDGKFINPIIRDGLQVMSIGFLVDEKSAVAWRGPMATSALLQLLNQTKWDEADFLIIDLPPGTGDIQLTLGQKIPVSGSVIVTTPQEIALLDVRRGIEMFKKVNIPLLGIIENLNLFTCPKCGHEEPLFGFDGGKSLAENENIQLCGSIPIDRELQESVDKGDYNYFSRESKTQEIFKEITCNITAKLCSLGKNPKSIFPEIKVEKV